MMVQPSLCGRNRTFHLATYAIHFFRVSNKDMRRVQPNITNDTFTLPSTFPSIPLHCLYLN